LIEAIGLWAWIREAQAPASAGLRRAGWIFVAPIATVLLIAGPLLRVSAPLLAQSVTVADRVGDAARLKADPGLLRGAGRAKDGKGRECGILAAAG
jgi:hypothetical protein